MLRLVVKAMGLHRVDWLVMETWDVYTGLIWDGVLRWSMVRF